MLQNVCYVLYALTQAILVARYIAQAKEKDNPVCMVVIMMLFAPVVTIGLAIFAFYAAVMWLVTYRSSEEN